MGRSEKAILFFCFAPLVTLAYFCCLFILCDNLKKGNFFALYGGLSSRPYFLLLSPWIGLKSRLFSFGDLKIQPLFFAFLCAGWFEKWDLFFWCFSVQRCCKGDLFFLYETSEKGGFCSFVRVRKVGLLFCF